MRTLDTAGRPPCVDNTNPGGGQYLNKGVCLIFKAITLLLLVCEDYLMVRVVLTGRANVINRTPQSVHVHKKQATFLLLLLIVVLLIVEVGVRLRGGLPSDLIFRVHLAFAISFMADLGLMYFWLTGERSALHTPLSYLAIALLGAINGTSIPLTLRLS